VAIRDHLLISLRMKDSKKIEFCARVNDREDGFAGREHPRARGKREIERA
jgi:hypothetical protein